MTDQEMSAVLKLIETGREADQEARAGIVQHLDDLERRLTKKLEDLCRALREHEGREERAAADCRKGILESIEAARAAAVAEATKPSPYALAGRGIYRGLRDVLSLIALGAGLALTIMNLVGG